ncbi:probable protein S-acyltransferase 4 [Lolium perenne]|uniref:probable protein S-acyltransferase 4 n=2 Tax=Lolium TaxID=4520 RepID=UPI0021F506BB|nr:probable protein S-acyltransferase 4 [Lolium perenne]
MEEEPNRRRLYQVWRGSNKFLCGGRLIFGPDAGSLFLSTALIAGPLVGLCCQCITKMNSSSSDQKNHVLGLPVLIVTVVLGLANLAFLLLTSSRDPGIVPRNARPPECGAEEQAVDMTTPSTEWVNAASPHLRVPRTKDVVVNGCTVKVKYCDTCLLYRPPRTSHCSICNNCVQKFDHHCPWVGQCIGLRNYRFFFLFISTSTFLCFYVFALSWLNITTEREEYGGSLLKSMRGEVLSVVLIVYTFVSVWFVGGLTVFHTYLMSTNQTTYENFRYRYDKKENPYNRGALANVAEVFFTRMPPSLNRFRSWVSDDEDAYGGAGGGPLSPMSGGLDLEMGRKGVHYSAGGVPAILQGMDYSEMEKMEGAGVHVKDRQAPPEAPDLFMISAARQHDVGCGGGDRSPPIVHDQDAERTLVSSNENSER